MNKKVLIYCKLYLVILFFIVAFSAKGQEPLTGSFLKGDTYFDKAIGDERIVLITDYDNDRLNDMITRISPSGEIRFYHNTGTTFSYDFSLNAQPYAFSANVGNTNEQNQNVTNLMDFDNDGINDFLVHGANFYNCSSNSVRIYWGNANPPYFTNNNYTELAVTNPYCIGAYGADLNNDGFLDVFIRNCKQTNLYINRGNRTFVRTDVFNTGRDINVVFDDYNQDGNIDLCYTKNGWADNQWGFRFNRGTGACSFDASTIVNYPAYRPIDGFLNFNADPIEDTIPDVAISCSDDGYNCSKIYIGEWSNSTNNFVFSSFNAVNSDETRIVQSFDINSDNYEDIIIRTKNGNTYNTLAYLNDGHGNFTNPLSLLNSSPYYVYNLWRENDELFVTAYHNSTNFDSLVVFKLNIIPPTIETAPMTDISANTAICGGEITSSGGVPIIKRGVCWSTSHNPTITDNHTSDSVGTGHYTSYITGLTPNTTYYVRAYATNSVCTAYGIENTFTTYCGNDTLFYIKDDFNDGVINTEYWTTTGNAVIESDGILKIQQMTRVKLELNMFIPNLIL